MSDSTFILALAAELEVLAELNHQLIVVPTKTIEEMAVMIQPRDVLLPACPLPKSEPYYRQFEKRRRK